MPDLVIGGGRRTTAPRPWRAGVIAVALLGVMISVAWMIYRRSVAYDLPGGEVHGAITSAQAGPGAPAVLAFGASSLAWDGGLAVLRATGDAHAIGAAYGRLLAPLLPAAVRARAASIDATIADDGWFSSWTHGLRLGWQWRFIDDALTESDRRIVAGMTRGAAASGISLPYDDLLRDQAVLDVGAPAPDSGEAEAHTVAHSLTIVAQQAEAPARVWIGRTFALSGLEDGGDSAVPIVEIVHPEGQLAWAGVGWPGLAGVVTGINAQGIAVMVDPARTGDVRVSRAARPLALLARAVLEQAHTLDAAVKQIEATPTLGAGVFVLADGATGAWLAVERTPNKAVVVHAPKPPVFGDVLTSSALAADPDNDRARRMLTTSARIDRAAKLVHAPVPDLATMASVLRDQRALDDAPRPAGHRGVIDDGRAVQQVILDPASMELWVADPTAGGRMRGFDLHHELVGDGERAAPPADIPADPSAAVDRVAILVAARADLRVARADLARGDRAAADEACARALSRAPTLPEALELAATVAQARGDLPRARALFQRWLDGGPDDPLGEERARALLGR